ETVERYSAFHPERHRLKTARARDLPDETPPLALLNGLDAEQRAATGYGRLTDRTSIAWCEGRALRDGRPVFVPAAAVFLNRSWNPAERRLGALISHGLAAHRSRRAARELALLELYERYHLTAAWHRQDFGGHVSESVLPPALAETRERMRSTNLKFNLMNLTPRAAAPVILAVVHGDRYPWIRLGAAARRELPDAAAHALLEAVAGWQRTSRKPRARVVRLDPVTGAA